MMYRDLKVGSLHNVTGSVPHAVPLDKIANPAHIFPMTVSAKHLSKGL